MTAHNAEIAAILAKLADLLEIQGENPFRIRAYRNAARIIGNMPKDIATMMEEGVNLTDIPGIGEGIAEKIKVIIATHELPLLKKVETRTPAILSELMDIQGLGPKRVQSLYYSLHIHNIGDLEKAIERGEVRKLKGFGEKIEERIKIGIKHLSEYVKRFKLADAATIAKPLLSYLKKCKGVISVECAGSYRRRKDTVGDLDILAIAKNESAVIKHFIKFDEVTQILSRGTTRSTVHLRGGIQVDLRVVPQISYGAALLYLTGSKAHNINLRKIAVQRKLKINEYGIFRGNKRIAGKTELEMYRAVGLPFIEPELREDRGEITAAKNGKLPKLITLNDIRGDLHCHTNATDGIENLEEISKAAIKFGHEYIAITDHSQHLSVAHGLDKKRLLQQIKAIDHLNEKLNKIIILKSIEVDILEDGSLDLPDDILKQLDLTVCSLHSKFNLSRKKQTERIIRAMDNPYFNILAHPTGRLINKREAYEIDIDRVMQAAKDRNCILELNSQPERMDMNDIQCKMAKEIGLKIAISTDAHSVSHFEYLQYGVYQARRGWLEKNDVINTYNIKDLRKILTRV